MAEARWRLAAIFLVASGVGVLSGLFGIGGGTLLVPLLILFFDFEQHTAQGTSLVALVPPTGLLALFEYYRANHVDTKVGLLLIPGAFFGALLGGKLAQELTAKRMRRVFVGFLFLLGLWEVASRWVRS